jgi:uncharacterized protein DUF1161
MIAWICASVLVVLLGVFLGGRQWFFGVVGVLGVAGLLLYMSQQRTTEQTPGAGKETAISWVPRASKPGTQPPLTPQAWPEEVSTPAEAAQAVQRLRAAHDMQGQDDEEYPARTVPPVDVRPLASLASQPATLVLVPASQAVLPSEAHDAAGRAAVPMGPAVPTPSAPSMGRAIKSCDTLKSEIQAKLEAKNLTGYTLTILTREDLQGLPVVGHCEGNTKTIVLNRARNAP